MNYEFHPVANLFPMMDQDTFAELCKDIEANGLIEPIWLHDGKIIDGRNRYKACLQVGVPPMFRTWKNDGSLVGFVVSLNLNRRHLTTGQKAQIGLDLLPMLEAEAKERMRKGGASHTGNQYTCKEKMEGSTELNDLPKSTFNKAAAQAAKLVGTSATRIYEMKRIQREAPERVEAIKNGEVSIDKVIREIKAKKEVVVGSGETHKPFKQATEAMQFVVIAISQLDRIREDDPQKVSAFQRVTDYINKRLQGV